MRVDLRGRDGLVTQEVANVPDVGAALEELGRIAVPEHVRMHVDTEPPGRASYRPRDRTMAERAAGRRGEECGVRRGRGADGAHSFWNTRE